MQVNGPASPISRVPLPASARAPRAGAAPDPAAATTGPAEPSFADLLTAEERAFFEQQEALGALSYRPGSAPVRPANAPLGQRIDVRG
jgi:hypothetical protein